MQTKFHSDAITCDGCASSIKRVLSRMAGVQTVEVDVDSKQITVGHNDTAEQTTEIIAALDRAGFPVASPHL